MDTLHGREGMVGSHLPEKQIILISLHSPPRWDVSILPSVLTLWSSMVVKEHTALQIRWLGLPSWLCPSLSLSGSYALQNLSELQEGMGWVLASHDSSWHPVQWIRLKKKTKSTVSSAPCMVSHHGRPTVCCFTGLFLCVSTFTPRSDLFRACGISLQGGGTWVHWH